LYTFHKEYRAKPSRHLKEHSYISFMAPLKEQRTKHVQKEVWGGGVNDNDQQTVSLSSCTPVLPVHASAEEVRGHTPARWVNIMNSIVMHKTMFLLCCQYNALFMAAVFQMEVSWTYMAEGTSTAVRSNPSNII
jgi:hypothetical protein